ncbi:MAG TPA: hypothetical protein VLM40_21495 [Gemmata sp.]|nr:hypothetical protein [Gemmata sp.]
MTWLGKILTFVVMIGAVVWAYFTAQAFVTRVNWKTEADRQSAARKASDAAHVSDAHLYAAEIDTLKRRLAVAEAKNTEYSQQIAKYEKEATELANIRMAGQKRAEEFDAKMIEREAKVARTLAELTTVRARNDVLENQNVRLTLDVEAAKREETKAKNEAKLALAIADESSRKVEDLQNRLAEMRAPGGRGAVTRSFSKAPPPVLANLRGEVTAVAGDLVTLSVGIDAGIGVGTTLDIYRLDGAPRYLGTVKVTSAFNLFPKQAIATFIPADNVPLARLRPEQLPKKGDEVRPLNAATGGGQ